LFAVFYRLLDLCGLSRSYSLMTMGPKCLQGAVCGLGDYGLYLAAKSAFGPKVAKWTATLQLTSWLVFFLAPRTLTNTMEMALLCMGLKFYPWREPGESAHFSL
jgi:phosphatidylinositol glycan class B